MGRHWTQAWALRPPSQQKSGLGSTWLAPLVEGPPMYSWLYRNRSQLAQIYGLPASSRVKAEPMAVPAGRKGLQLPPPGAGTVLRRQRYVLLKPMPRRVA